jgi:hypothetical protein
MLQLKIIIIKTQMSLFPFNFHFIFFIFNRYFFIGFHIGFHIGDHIGYLIWDSRHNDTRINRSYHFNQINSQKN